MRSILLCITLLLFGLLSKAQTNMPSLNITLTDVQSVTFNNSSSNQAAVANSQIIQNAGLNVFSSSTSQIKKISSENSEYERLYKEFYAEKSNIGQSFSTDIYSVALNSPSGKIRKSAKTPNLVIYQIDPR
ncbi:hypothetical protein [Daejeonella sp.]|uniref:hypothetical protein n=1 Tax=Daejeonella sp. TaxID=2805397 RepID=UPI0039832C5E